MLYEAVHNTLSRFKRIKPITIALLVTGKCNARCVMCNIWKDGLSQGTELTTNQYETLLRNKFFSSISSVMISGGEALLRSDIVDIVEIIVHSLPRLRKITIATNGLATGLILKKINQIAQIKGLSQKSRLFVQVSYDAVSNIHDNIRGPDAHNRVTSTMNRLLQLRTKYRFLHTTAACVVQPMNLEEIPQVFSFLRKNNIPSIFTYVWTDPHYFQNQLNNEIKFDKKQFQELKKVYFTLSKKEKHIGKKFLYYEFHRMLDGRESSRACPALRDTITIEPNGNVIPCLNSEKRSMGNVANEDIYAIWNSEETLAKVRTIQQSKCGSCMLACGVSYWPVLKFVIFDIWKIYSHRAN